MNEKKTDTPDKAPSGKKRSKPKNGRILSRVPTAAGERKTMELL